MIIIIIIIVIIIITILFMNESQFLFISRYNRVDYDYPYHWQD